MKLLNFENWSSGDWRRKLTLKVKFWHFLTPCHYSNSQNSIISFVYSWFLAKNLSNFVSFPWKLHNRYCHTLGSFKNCHSMQFQGSAPYCLGKRFDACRCIFFENHFNLVIHISIFCKNMKYSDIKVVNPCNYFWSEFCSHFLKNIIRCSSAFRCRKTKIYRVSCLYMLVSVRFWNFKDGGS